MTEITIIQGLPKEALAIRQEVFVEEQGFHDEFDDIDSIAHHLILYVDGQAAGCCRLFPSKRENTYVIGRLAVHKQFRGKAYGKLILQEAEKWLCQQNVRTLELSAQVRVRPFYESLGYTASGEEYLDEYCPHIHMEKNLGEHSLRLKRREIPDSSTVADCSLSEPSYAISISCIDKDQFPWFSHRY